MLAMQGLHLLRSVGKCRKDGIVKMVIFVLILVNRCKRRGFYHLAVLEAPSFAL
jgi:hypothetical protein